MISLANLRKPEDLPRIVGERAALDMVLMSCFCTREYPKYISCFLDVAHDDAPFVARSLDGEAIEPTRVSFVVNLPDGFSCARRDQGCLATKGHCLCKQVHSRPNPRLKRHA